MRSLPYGCWFVACGGDPTHTLHSRSHLLRPHPHFQGKIKKIDKFCSRSFLPLKIKRRMYKKERNVAMQHKFIQSNFQSNNFRNCEFLPSRNCTPQFHNNIPSESSKVQLKLPQVKNSRNLSRSIVHLAPNSSSPTTLFPPTFPSRNPRFSAHHPPSLSSAHLPSHPISLTPPRSPPLFPHLPLQLLLQPGLPTLPSLSALPHPARGQGEREGGGPGAEDILLPALPSARLA